jgi:hypothetical protein
MRSREIVIATACAMVASQALTGQVLEVGKSPISVDTPYVESGEAFEHPLVAIRFGASGGEVGLEGFGLDYHGNDFADGVSEVQVWLDDGDGAFDTSDDVLLWSGSATLPGTSVVLPSALQIVSDSAVDLWIVLSFTATAGSSVGKTYQVSVSAFASIVTNAPVIVQGSEPPESPPLKLIYFEVSSAVVHCDTLGVRGSGFTPPLQILVNGVIHEGNYLLDDDHKSFTFSLDLGKSWIGSDLEFHVVTSTLGQKYIGVLPYHWCFVGSSGSTGSSGCASDSYRLTPWLLLAAVVLVRVFLFAHHRGRRWPLSRPR